MSDPLPLLPTPRWAFASLPKPGHRADENEDAVGANPAALRFCVVDGATEGWRSGPWARHLAERYARRPPEPRTFSDWLAAVRADWPEVAAEAAEPWYAQAKRAEGAFATLVGVELRAAADAWRWKAVGVGDSCLFHLRDGLIEQSFPLTAAEQFGTTPALLPSNPAAAAPEADWLAGFARPGDLLALATDAVAACLLGDPDLIAPLGGIVTAAGESAAAGNRRLVNFLKRLQPDRDDDLTLLVIHLPDGRAEERR